MLGVEVPDGPSGEQIGDTTIPLPNQPAVNIVPSPTGGAWVTFGTQNTVSPAALRIPYP
jgi:hypothetical protein